MRCWLAVFSGSLVLHVALGIPWTVLGEERLIVPAPGPLPSFLHGQSALTAEYAYTGEVFTNVHGGLNAKRATEFGGLLDLVIIADLDRVGWVPGGRIMLFGQNGHGRGLTAQHVGDWQVLSNIDAPDFVQMSEFWWERSLFDGWLLVKLGKQDANAEFAAVEMGTDFINSSFGFHPTIPMPSFPSPSMAATVFVHLTDWLAFEAGVWDGAPEIGNWGFSGTGETFSICEIELSYELLGGLPGNFHVGPWYHSGQFPDVARGSNTTFTGSHGIHCEMQQALFREPCCAPEEQQGLGAFAQYGWAPQDRSPVEHYVGAGVVYRGLIRHRDDDTLGLGAAHVIFSERLPDQSTETALELFYRAQLSPRTAVQPDLQYIAQPNGNGRDALVAGLRFQFAL